MSSIQIAKPDSTPPVESKTGALNVSAQSLIAPKTSRFRRPDATICIGILVHRIEFSRWIRKKMSGMAQINLMESWSISSLLQQNLGIYDALILDTEDWQQWGGLFTDFMSPRNPDLLAFVVVRSSELTTKLKPHPKVIYLDCNHMTGREVEDCIKDIRQSQVESLQANSEKEESKERELAQTLDLGLICHEKSLQKEFAEATESLEHPHSFQIYESFNEFKEDRRPVEYLYVYTPLTFSPSLELAQEMYTRYRAKHLGIVLPENLMPGKMNLPVSLKVFQRTQLKKEIHHAIGQTHSHN